MSRWLVTGCDGQLGSQIVRRLRRHDLTVAAMARRDLDITDAVAVEAAIADLRPDVVINAAAYTAVDDAEADEVAADRVNNVGARNLAEALAQRGGRLIHVSTDYVFDGASTEPYEVGDPVGPRTAYGRTKLAGERAVLTSLPDRSHVVRTAWLYGGPGPNFVDTMLKLEVERELIDVVADQVGSPTWVGDLAGALVELGGRDTAPGILHYVNSGRGSWFDLAREVFRLSGADPDRVRTTDSRSFVRPAQRPAWSVLSVTSWTERGLTAPRPWRQALAAALQRRQG